MGQVPDHVRQYLAAHNTMSLATCDGTRPWAASVFYASDNDLNLYFVSDVQTRHCLDLASNGLVAATINDDCDDWNRITGLQITGEAKPVPANDRARVETLYLEKFSAIRELIQSPKTDREKIIAGRLRDAKFYCITPDWLRLINNTETFGHKEEYTLFSTNETF